MVNETTGIPERRLSGSLRAAAAGIGLILGVLLCVAAVLKPNVRGRGTHEQLGFPPCSIVTLFGVPCPSCGMTTSWANLVRGRVIAAWKANAGGTLLAMAAIWAAPWLMASAAVGRWVAWTPRSDVAVVVSVLIFVVTLVDWTLRLAAG